MFETKIPRPKAGSFSVARPAFLPMARAAVMEHQCECGGGCNGECSQHAMSAFSAVQHSPISSALGPSNSPVAPVERRSHPGFDFSSIPIHRPGQPGAPFRGASALPAFAVDPNLEEARPQAATPLLASSEITKHGARSRGALEVSEPSDAAELEADRLTERLFPSSSQSEHASPNAKGTASIDVWAPVRLAQRKSVGGEGLPCKGCGNSDKLPGGVVDSGSRLPEHTRTEMESAFGADFSSVRIHTNSGAAQLSRSLKAPAFTYGNHIFFDQGQYDPESVRGKRLLTHELTHTVQQRDAIAMLTRQGGTRTTLQCVNENLSSAGVAAWLLAIVGTTCGLIFGIAGSPTGPGAAGTAAFGAALCIAGVIGASVGAVLGVISGCWRDPNFRSRGAYLSYSPPAGGGRTGAGVAASTSESVGAV